MRFPAAKSPGSQTRYASSCYARDVGLLLLDNLQRPLYINDEAVAILTYPESPRTNKRLGSFLAQRVDSLLSEQNAFSCSKHSVEFASGRRHYQVRIFEMKSHLRNGLGPTTAVLLERNHSTLLDFSRILQKFRLTRRESETVDLLMQGYTSTSQIASRMDVSPNTAKAFLRSIMFKTGACDRSGILAKILQLLNSSV
jgi:DNA-binding CsgD family transcriptional regulator